MSEVYTLKDFEKAQKEIWLARESADKVMRKVFPLYARVNWYHGWNLRTASVVDYGMDLRIKVLGDGPTNDKQYWIDARRIIRVVPR